ncbi:hypothetical protein H4J46_08690 [Colwellia sp. MB02u-6]|nr:hypothetical protein [Colwellia sp. MB02u-6]
MSLHEIKIAGSEFVQIDILCGDNFAEEFKQKYPLTKIPILVNG